ncbi:hypothetical protein CGZ80_03500 [Rhodopirellula sp. MGV]|nr:hypothetical protein CGZ80_03500 [Rhodopirellula sp. MGV]PNY34978.1 hypothetical protein C2E31_20385 [Rhodopirellula baltica]
MTTGVNPYRVSPKSNAGKSKQHNRRRWGIVCFVFFASLGYVVSQSLRFGIDQLLVHVQVGPTVFAMLVTGLIASGVSLIAPMLSKERLLSKELLFTRSMAGMLFGVTPNLLMHITVILAFRLQQVSYLSHWRIWFLVCGVWAVSIAVSVVTEVLCANRIVKAAENRRTMWCTEVGESTSFGA